jgi:hypothetical protein
MGAGVDRAVDARRKLERAAETFLGRKVNVAACVSKIAGGRTTVLYRGPLVQGAIEVLQWLEPVVREAEEAVATSSAASLRSRFKLAVESGASAAPAPAAAPAKSLIETKPETPVSRLGHAGQANGQASGQSNGHVAPPAAAPIARPAVPPPSDAAAEATDSSPLASHLPGLTPMDAACPYAPQVELAADASGTIHLLARMGDEASGPPMVNQLLTADAWARAHWPLLRKSIAKPTLSHDFQSRLHLFTDAAPKIRLLGEADLRLHLLAPVQAAGQTVWFCTDLN